MLRRPLRVICWLTCWVLTGVATTSVRAADPISRVVALSNCRRPSNCDVSAGYITGRMAVSTGGFRYFAMTAAHAVEGSGELSVVLRHRPFVGIRAERVGAAADARLDLALVAFDVPAYDGDSIGSDAVEAGVPVQNAEVTAIGHAVAKWDVRQSFVTQTTLPAASRFTIKTREMGEGNSGGPVTSQSGQWLGIFLAQCGQGSCADEKSSIVLLAAAAIDALRAPPFPREATDMVLSASDQLASATLSNDVNQIRLLLQQGARIDVRFVGGLTPLALAAGHNIKDLVPFLCQPRRITGSARR